jgi:hypothetical protein
MKIYSYTKLSDVDFSINLNGKVFFKIINTTEEHVKLVVNNLNNSTYE